MAQRVKSNFNRDWKFKIGEHKGAEMMTYKDDDWEHIGLPHSFSTPYFMSTEFYTGYGWYRKVFRAPQHYKSKRLFLEFEGAFQDAEIFVNGKNVGTHQGGYTGFSIDITTAIKEGNNLVAVRLNNLWNPRLAPRAGEHIFSGGIYRDVFLVVTDPIHVDWYGTFVSTPKAELKEASVKIETAIRNDGNKAETISLKTDILDPDGKLIVSDTLTKTIATGMVETFLQTTSEFESPKLWSPEQPVLYKAVQTLLDGNKKIDAYETTFGIRSIKWAADSGFFLNGKHYYLKGANVHQDHAGWGDAVTNSGFYRDVKMMKDAGFNFIRGSHYPHDPAFAAACDQIGLLFWSENAFWGIGGFNQTPEGYWNSSAYPTKKEDQEAFDESVLQQLKEMIRIFRNHPSIIAWSMSNEPFFSSEEVMGKVRDLLKKEVKLSHILDSTRLAAIGGAQRPLDKGRIDILGDIAGYNGDGASISVFQNPGIPNIVSEYSSVTADRPGIYSPQWGDLEKDNGEFVHNWRSGQSIWCGFDHGSIAGQRLGKMGIVDYFRIPKQAWYWYRNAYTGAPVPAVHKKGIPVKLRLEADRTEVNKTDGTEDVYLSVFVLDKDGNKLDSNPSVKLQVVSGPGEFPTGRSIEFKENTDLRIMDGQAAIELRSYYSGKSLIVAHALGLKSDSVSINFKGEIPFNDSLKAPDRPYIRFEKNKQASKELRKFGMNNPAFSSTSYAEYSSGFGVDGNLKTFWKPLASDAAPSFILDTEKGINIRKVKLVFPQEKLYQFKVEISEDKQIWQLLSDYSKSTSKEKEIEFLYNGKQSGRFVRISFTSAKQAAIAELEVNGFVLE